MYVRCHSLPPLPPTPAPHPLASNRTLVHDSSFSSCCPVRRGPACTAACLSCCASVHSVNIHLPMQVMSVVLCICPFICLCRSIIILIPPRPHPARAPPPLSLQLFALRPYRHDDMELLVLAPSAPVGCQLGRFDAAPPDVCVRAQWLCCHVGTGHLLQTSRVLVVAYVRSVVDPWTHRVSAAGSSKPSLIETKAHVCRYGAAPRDEWCLFQAPTVIEFDDACKQ